MSYDDLFVKCAQFEALATMTRSQALAILGVPEGASEEHIKKEYRRKIKEVHPDLLGHLSPEERAKAAAKAVELNVAQDVLLKPELTNPLFGDMRQEQEVIRDVDTILNKHQEIADDWLDNVRKRREWSDYMGGDIKAEDLKYEDNRANSIAVERKREAYRRKAR